MLIMQGETPRDIAERKGFHEVAELLDNPPVTRIPVQHNQDSTKKHHKDHSTTSQEGKKEKKKKHKFSKKSSKVHFSDGKKKTAKCGNISPYGCHQSPDPESFPSLKLMSLPQEPLKSGEQYYADLAGNIKKGPRGLGYTCYCAPFFHHVERKLDAQKKELLEKLEGQGENLEAKIRGLEKRTKERLSGLDQRVKESLAAERGECAERIDRRLFRERCELDQRQERTTRALRSEMRAWSRGETSAQSGLEPEHNIDIPLHNNGATFYCNKDYSQCGLSRSKSEDMLSDTQSHQNSISLVSGTTSRFSGHGKLWNGSAAANKPDNNLRTGNSKHEQSVSRLKMKCLGNFDLKRESRSEGDLTRCHIISDQDSELTNNNVVQNDMTVKASSKYPYSPESNNDVSDYNGTPYGRNISLNKNIPSNMNISFKNTFRPKSKQPSISKPTILSSMDNRGTSYVNDPSHSMNIKSPYRTNHNHDQNHKSAFPLENNDGSSFV
ncbi:uncharacterized protein LOC129218665 [Uloborus diversus]|uniref:uncharacterized protein LOC129218665 n=1 Tax=Uloborus diversus TaxID=327109 RepID=UPI00240A4415|nr:uncharacterized protein LOC129218665 [Uloborus diversus]